jgi:magnesium transporter
VGEAITALQSARDVEMVFYLYVIDARKHLVGVTSLRRLLLVSPETPLKRIMTPEVISVRVDTDQEEVARLVASYNLLAVPVVDDESKLVGVITVDDVIDVIKDEATEDLYRLAGVSGDERVATPPFESLRKRLPWLGVNLVTAFVAASVVALFEGTIQRVTALAVFMPIVAGMGGNAATQTLTVIVRGIALGELSWSNARKTVFKEAAIGLGSGLSLGLAAAGVAWVTKQDPMQHDGGHRCRHARPPRTEGAQDRPGARVVGVHHHVHRRGRLRLVSGVCDNLPALPGRSVASSQPAS